ncbi:MAG: hypothetical protein ACE37H_16605 [Phycisphaeraceae bacterium]
MQTLELDCPSCGEHLELDTGFAGGVCRCSNCGTLMTVPRDAGRAERLTAPERGAELSDATIDPADLQELAPPRPSARSAGGKRGKSKKGKGKSAAQSSTIQAGEYVTASGKVVRVEQATRVPMAQSKRQKVRLVTTLVFAAIIFSVVVIAGVAIWAMVSGGRSADGEQAGANGQQQPPPPTYDASANPYTLGFANVAGVPVTGRVAIVVEASKADSEFWMPAASEMIRAGLGRGNDASTRVAFFSAQKADPAAYDNAGFTATTKLDDGALKKWFDGLAYDKPVDRTAAIERALKAKPDTLVLVFSGATSNEMAAWEKRFKSNPNTTVHGVLIDSLAPRPVLNWLQGLKSGEAISLSTSEIKDWADEKAEEP